MTSSNLDPIIRDHRKQIADNDLKIVAALNTRISLVKSLKEHKDAQGLSFHDATQEDWVISQLCQANGGPMSEDGLREIFSIILGWTKREVAGMGNTAAE